jgi:hypothetical protein
LENNVLLDQRCRTAQGIKIQSDSKLLAGFPWPIKGNPDNNLESLCIWGQRIDGMISRGKWKKLREKSCSSGTLSTTNITKSRGIGPEPNYGTIQF